MFSKITKADAFYFILFIFTLVFMYVGLVTS
ncbi:hypothetical protein BN1058_01931 [Paraliobacillus sp. PM-2]|nr:hypothetical protein BN1058_01931 [Paraliobacillus sp. PM-2]